MAKIVTVDIDFEKDALSDDFKEFITALLNFLEGKTVLSSSYDDDKKQLEVQYLEEN
ncbi:MULTISPECIES: hypothetical protein [Lactobacillus]|uniref:hypothetical protein n=1 Tax=Lactobacillus TaxID=1578 RepID=UPI000ABC287E|nr:MULTISPECIES: hypothetical protein [Lactobacillus]